jgi:hypothetical protein
MIGEATAYGRGFFLLSLFISVLALCKVDWHVHPAPDVGLEVWLDQEANCVVPHLRLSRPRR